MKSQELFLVTAAKLSKQCFLSYRQIQLVHVKITYKYSKRYFNKRKILVTAIRSVYFLYFDSNCIIRHRQFDVKKITPITKSKA